MKKWQHEKKEQNTSKFNDNRTYAETGFMTLIRCLILQIFVDKPAFLVGMAKSYIYISITVILNILLSSPAQAESFENLLKSSLTPAEVEIHNIMGDKQALETARNACLSLQKGSSVQEFSTQAAISLLQRGLTQEQLQTAALYTGKVIATGVTSFCPEYKSKLQEL